MTDKLKAKLPLMLAEHKAIVVALDHLAKAANTAGKWKPPVSPKISSCTLKRKKRFSYWQQAACRRVCPSATIESSTFALCRKEPYREGVVYYLQEGRVRGVLLWNVWGQVDAARRLIAEPGPFRSEDLKGRLPEKH